VGEGLKSLFIKRKSVLMSTLRILGSGIEHKDLWRKKGRFFFGGKRGG